MLVIERVSKIYKSGTFGSDLKLALRQVSFGIDKGEVVSLIGESGSGKSTLGKIVLRLTPLSGGRVLFEGTDIKALKRKELHDYYCHVQGVFQDPFSSYNPLYKADRVFEMVRQEYFAGLHGDEWEAKIASALEAVTLNPADVLNKFPHQLSGGQQQRLLVARALLLDVKLLIADEIISMLDASTRVDVLNMLVHLKKRGLGILFITHDLSLGNYISDRTVILRAGTVMEMGLTAKVFGNPQHPYTKSLLTAVPQLHKKWEHVEAGSPTAPIATNGIGTARDKSEPASMVERRRYSRSSLSPTRGSTTQVTRPAAKGGGEYGSHPSLMDISDAPWQRWGPGSVNREAFLLSQVPPPLVECEDGHFVAVEQ
ncbi:MAG TPA: ABC transporter ATP-binding protein [Acidimicrobiales bacterium]|nr:ABC transporter ATP-binding protein [Acidimicrobiales bacterium]